MARKSAPFTVQQEGRDKGKTFVLTEMPALQAEKWAWRAFGAMARAGVEIPPHVANMGMVGILAVGLRAVLGADFREAEPLLDELLGCAKISVPAMKEGREITPDDIEEASTYMLLRSAVLELHTGFSVAAYLSKQWAASKELLEKRLASQSTETSAVPSARS